jgi:hypothetical protein
MKAALFAACAPAVGAFRMLEDHCQGETHDLRYFDANRDLREVYGDLRRRLGGGAIGIVSFGDDGKHDESSLRAAQVASQRGLCAIVVTSAGYLRFVQLYGSLSPVDSQLLTHAVTSAIIVGKDEGASFVGFESIFPRAKQLAIGGLSWAPSSCIRIVEHIQKAANGGSLV